MFAQQTGKSECFDAGNPVGGIEPLNTSYSTMNFLQ